MKNEDFAKLLGSVDEQKLLDAGTNADAVHVITKKPFIRNKKRFAVILAAALLCAALTAGAVAAAFMNRGKTDAPEEVPTDQTTSFNPEHLALRAASGRAPAVKYDEGKGEGDSCLPAAAAVDIGFVAEAEVVETLPGTYVLPAYDAHYTILRMKIKDVLYGSGLPETITVCCSGCPDGLFQGYDDFLISVDQIGVENYLMIEEGTGTLTYFDHMFQFAGPIGSQIIAVFAFKDGLFDREFYEKATEGRPSLKRSWIKNYLQYQLNAEDFPAHPGDTAKQVKTALLSEIDRMKTDGNVKKPYNETNYNFPQTEPFFLNADDLFASVADKDLRAKLSPKRGVFLQELIQFRNGNDYIFRFTRLINGCLSDEQICVRSNGEVSDEGVIYTEEDLANIPDVTPVIEAFNGYDTPSPSAVLIKERFPGYYTSSYRADGFYRKIDGKNCALVRFVWFYDNGDFENVWRDVYIEEDYLFCDENGNCRHILAENLWTEIGLQTISLIPFNYRGILNYGNMQKWKENADTSFEAPETPTPAHEPTKDAASEVVDYTEEAATEECTAA